MAGGRGVGRTRRKCMDYLDRKCMTTTIRSETSADYDSIRELTINAFEASEFGHNGEADLLDSIWASKTDYLSLVACQAEQIVGHIMFSSVRMMTCETESLGMGLAPMAVAPSLQRTGIGSLLVQNGIDRLFKKEIDFVVVLGHPDYYPRFGFRPVAEFNASHGFSGIPQNVFFIRFRQSDTINAEAKKQIEYSSEFGPQFVGA